MKTNSIIALIVSISLFGLFGCADKYEAVSYTHLTLPTIA